MFFQLNIKSVFDFCCSLAYAKILEKTDFVFNM